MLSFMRELVSEESKLWCYVGGEKRMFGFIDRNDKSLKSLYGGQITLSTLFFYLFQVKGLYNLQSNCKCNKLQNYRCN